MFTVRISCLFKISFAGRILFVICINLSPNLCFRCRAMQWYYFRNESCQWMRTEINLMPVLPITMHKLTVSLLNISTLIQKSSTVNSPHRVQLYHLHNLDVVIKSRLIFECSPACSSWRSKTSLFIMHIIQKHTLSLPLSPSLIALVIQQGDSDNEGSCPWTWSKALLLTGIMSCSFLVPSPQSL